PIPQRRVLGHSDVAPDRKEDPGELFDWERLARAGIGLWPEPGLGESRDIATMQAQLAQVGYAVPGHGRLDSATRSVIRAFQRHFRPTLVDGTADQETLARLDGILAIV
ncbi:MAG: peptidoglycan-binding protein, partial [Pseudomonadota bacterium]